MKSELSELKINSDGKALDLKETLSSKNFELTRLDNFSRTWFDKQLPTIQMG